MNPRWPSFAEHQATYTEMMTAAKSLKLPVRNRTWSGQVGSWQGIGAGSSIDFKDHRPYLLGDDIRYINWQAYARTGQYTMKLYQEEVRPMVDIALDISPSMFFESEKRIRTLQIFYLSVASALQLGLSTRVYTVRGSEYLEETIESITMGTWLQKSESENPGVSPELRDIPWKSGSMRIFISDLLFSDSHHEILIPLTRNNGAAIVFAPFCLSESDPSWQGNVELVECETKDKKHLHFDSFKLNRYREAYQRHFESWRETCQKFTGCFARITSEENFINSLQHEAIPSGALVL